MLKKLRKDWVTQSFLVLLVGMCNESYSGKHLGDF